MFQFRVGRRGENVREFLRLEMPQAWHGTLVMDGFNGLGRQYDHFMRSDAGRERAAAFYSLVETSNLNGLDTKDYLRQLFTRIAKHPFNRIDELLPGNIGRPLHATEQRKMAV